MGEGILDSVDTVHKYWLLYEPMQESIKTKTKPDNSKRLKSQEQNEPAPKPLSLPTGLANFMSRRINYPTMQYMGKSAVHLKERFGKGKNYSSELSSNQIKLLSSKVTYLFPFCLITQNKISKLNFTSISQF